MANMAIEAGAKNGIFEVDDTTIEYVREHSSREPKVYKADEDAAYDETYIIDLSEMCIRDRKSDGKICFQYTCFKQIRSFNKSFKHVHKKRL